MLTCIDHRRTTAVNITLNSSFIPKIRPNVFGWNFSFNWQPQRRLTLRDRVGNHKLVISSHPNLTNLRAVYTLDDIFVNLPLNVRVFQHFVVFHDRLHKRRLCRRIHSLVSYVFAFASEHKKKTV